MRIASRVLAVAGAASLAIATGFGGLAVGAGLVGGGLPASPDLAPAAATDGDAASLVAGDLAVLAPELERAAGDPPGALRQRLLRLAGRNVVHAEVVVDRDGELVTFRLDRGTVSSVGSGTLSIAQAGGRSASVATTAETRVRRDRAKATLGDLESGDVAVVLSRVEGDTATAVFVLVPAERPAAKPAASPTAPSNG